MRHFLMVMFFTLSGFSLGGCRALELDVIRSVSMCDVHADLDRFQGQRIEVVGYLFTNWREYNGLVSEDCPERLLLLASSSSKPYGYDGAWDIMADKRGKSDIALLVRVEGTIVDINPVRGMGLSAQSYVVLETAQTPVALSFFGNLW